MIQLKSSSIRLAVGVLLYSAWLFAVPSAYVSDFGPLRIENQTNSTLIRDNKNANAVWVLPPTAGKTEFAGLVPNANLGFCPGLKELTIASNNIDKRIGAIQVKQEELTPELEAAEKDINAARKSLGEVSDHSELRAITALTDSIVQLEDRRAKAIEDLDRCTQSCEGLTALISSLGEELQKSRQELRTLESENRDLVRRYKVAKSRVEQAEENLSNVGARYLRLTQMLAELGSTVMNLYSSKGKLEGGIAQIDYNSGWDQNVSKLTGEYAHYTFERVPTYNVRIFANIVGAGDRVSYYESLPMILDYSINGLKYVPWGQVEGELTAMPSVMTGNIRLSTLGACPIIDPHFFDQTGMKPALGNLSTPLFSIGATYSYPAAFKFTVTASYNLYKFYEQIRNQGTSGGFFSSHAYNDVVEKKIDHDAFKINWQDEDPTSTFNEETRSKIQSELKKDLMNRVLVTIAQPGINGANEPILGSPGVPPENGAIVLANGLQATCGFNIYCQAGSWVLRGLSAIFGSSSSEQSFRQTWDRTSSETWSSETAKLRPGVMVFRR